MTWSSPAYSLRCQWIKASTVKCCGDGMSFPMTGQSCNLSKCWNYFVAAGTKWSGRMRPHCKRRGTENCSQVALALSGMWQTRRHVWYWLAYLGPICGSLASAGCLLRGRPFRGGARLSDFHLPGRRKVDELASRKILSGNGSKDSAVTTAILPSSAAVRLGQRESVCRSESPRRRKPSSACFCEW
jgi:hypothetical protein